MIAGLGWSHWAGLLAALTASAALGSLLGPLLFVGFLLGIGLPAWWLAYLALLARPGESQLEWYPIGRVLLWATLLAGGSVTIAILQIGPDQETMHSVLRRGLDEIVRTSMASPSLAATVTPDEQARLLDVFVVLLPPAAAASFLLINIFNLWLAGRVVFLSGRLPRPWPRVSEISIPAVATVLLGLAVIGAFVPDIVGSISSIMAASLMVLYVLVGLAVIHAVTIGTSARVLILASVYAGITVLSLQTSWAPVALAGLGLGETLFGIRGRVAKRVRPGQHT
jgi:hypothetical protein